MVDLPKDIENKIDRIFAVTERAEIKRLLLDLWSRNLNVGADQLARSILYLSDGNLDKLRTIFEKEFYGDPRDVIMMAEEKAGNPKHYFIISFDEIDRKVKN